MTLPKGYGDKDKDNSKDYDNKTSSGNDNDTNSNVSESDKKKWLIDKNEKLLEALINDLESERTQNKNDAELVENYYTRVRNPILAGVSFAAPIILALSSVPLLKDFILEILMIDVIIGLIAFLVFSSIKGKIHRHILIMDKSYLNAIKALKDLARYFADQTIELDKIEILKLLFFLEYIRFSENAVQAKLNVGLWRISRSMFFRDSEFRNRYQSLLQRMKTIIKWYETNPSRWDSFISDLKYMQNIHKDFFDWHNYTIEPTGKIVKQPDKR